MIFTPASDYNSAFGELYGLGSVTLIVRSGNPFTFGTAEGDIDTVDITVLSVNDRPSFTASDPIAVDPNAGPQTIYPWATFDPGAANETEQTATYVVSNISNPDLFATAPTIDSRGILTYTSAADAFGRNGRCPWRRFCCRFGCRLECRRHYFRPCGYWGVGRRGIGRWVGHHHCRPSRRRRGTGIRCVWATPVFSRLVKV